MRLGGGAGCCGCLGGGTIADEEEEGRGVCAAVVVG